jgi:hypothetical protein
MSQENERRRADRSGAEELSPEVLELLEICGGEIRESDREALARRRAAARGVPDRRHAQKDTERPEAAQGTTERPEATR